MQTNTHENHEALFMASECYSVTSFCDELAHDASPSVPAAMEAPGIEPGSLAGVV